MSTPGPFLMETLPLPEGQIRLFGLPGQPIGQYQAGNYADASSVIQRMDPATLNPVVNMVRIHSLRRPTSAPLPGEPDYPTTDPRPPSPPAPCVFLALDSPAWDPRYDATTAPSPPSSAASMMQRPRARQKKEARGTPARQHSLQRCHHRPRATHGTVYCITSRSMRWRPYKPLSKALGT